MNPLSLYNNLLAYDKIKSKGKDIMATASLILGILGLFMSLTIFKDLSLILSILGLVLGLIYISKEKKEKAKKGDKSSNKGIATAGVICATLGIMLGFITTFPGYDSGSGMFGDGGDASSLATTDNVEIEKMDITKHGDLVIKITNNNSTPVCLSYISAVFKDSNGNFVLKKQAQESFIVVPANGTTYDYFFGYGEDYSQYPEVSFSSEFANISYMFALNGIEITANNTGSQIAVVAKNNSGKSLSSVEVIVLYYQGNEIVGVETGSDFSTTANGSEAYINVEYPDDKSYKDVPFDRYEVYYLSAHLD